MPNDNIKQVIEEHGNHRQKKVMALASYESKGRTYRVFELGEFYFHNKLNEWKKRKSVSLNTGNFRVMKEALDRNHEAIIESTIKILSDYDKYKEIAIKGRQHVIENFNWAKITKEYENTIYETIKEFKNADI